MENMMNWKMAGMAGTALAVASLTTFSATAGSNRFTGNVSLAVGQTFQDDEIFATTFFDDSYTSISGGAQLNIAFQNNLNLQFDVAGNGAFVDDTGFFSFDRDGGFQAAATGYWRSGNYAVGLFAGAGVAAGADDGDAQYYFAGAKIQHYWNNFTFGLDGGYLDSTPSNGASPDDLFLSNAWFVNAETRWYATPKVTLTANVGYISGDRVGFGNVDQDTLHWGLKAAYKPEEKEPLSLWVAYEGRSTDYDFNPASTDRDSHTVKVGLTIHFGGDGDQREQDRSGPAFNTMDYGQIVVGG
jgi:hypothetical protein